MNPEQRKAALFVMSVTGKTWQQVLDMPLAWFMRIIEEWTVPAEAPKRWKS